MKALLILCISGAVLAQTPPPPKKAPAPATPATKAPATAAKAAPRPNPLLNPAALKAVAPELYRVKFTTTKGDFIVEVHRDWAPLGADRFWNLVRNKFFNDAPFFRYVPNFIVQFGLPADPAVAKAWKDANIKDEPVKHGNLKGTLVYAKAGPNTRTTQLFINFKDNTPLDADGFSAFGMITEGFEVAQGVYSAYGEQPVQDCGIPGCPSITTQGKAYVDKNFPKLDLIKSTTVIFPEPAAPGAKKAPATGAPATKTGTPPPATKATPPAAPKKQ